MRVRPPPHNKILAVLWAIKFLFSNPCGASWNTYLDTLPGALGRAALGFITPDAKNIAKWYIRPKNKGRYSRWPRRGKKERVRGRDGKTRTVTVDERGKGRFRRWIPPDPNEVVADRIPGRMYFADRTIESEGEKWFWSIFDVFEKGAFWFLIADTSADAVINWAKGIFAVACIDHRPVPVPMIEHEGGRELGWVQFLAEGIQHEGSYWGDIEWSQLPYFGLAVAKGGSIDIPWRRQDGTPGAKWSIIHIAFDVYGITRLTNPPWIIMSRIEYQYVNDDGTIGTSDTINKSIEYEPNYHLGLHYNLNIPNLYTIGDIYVSLSGFKNYIADVSVQGFIMENPAYR